LNLAKLNLSQDEIINGFKKPEDVSIFEKSGKRKMYIDISSKSFSRPIKLTTINEVFEVLGLQLVIFIGKN